MPSKPLSTTVTEQQVSQGGDVKEPFSRRVGRMLQGRLCKISSFFVE